MDGFEIEMVPPEMREMFTPIATKLATEIQMTEEQKAQAVERSMKLQSDPDFLAQVMEVAEKTFAEADADSDKVLNEAEFINFIGLMKTSAEQRNDHVPDYTPEQMKMAYAAINKLNDKKEGLTLDEIVIGRMMVNILVQEMAMAAAANK